MYLVRLNLGYFWLSHGVSFLQAAHITGGGLFQNIPRMLPESVQAVIRADTWDLPAVFRWIGIRLKTSVL